MCIRKHSALQNFLHNYSMCCINTACVVIHSGCGADPYVVQGNASVCMINAPETLNHIDGIIYVGAQIPIDELEGQSYGVYLSLNYSE